MDPRNSKLTKDKDKAGDGTRQGVVVDFFQTQTQTQTHDKEAMYRCYIAVSAQSKRKKRNGLITTVYYWHLSLRPVTSKLVGPVSAESVGSSGGLDGPNV